MKQKPKRRIRLGRFSTAPRSVDLDNTLHPTVSAYPIDRRKAKADAAAWDARAAAGKALALQTRRRPPRA